MCVPHQVVGPAIDNIDTQDLLLFTPEIVAFCPRLNAPPCTVCVKKRKPSKQVKKISMSSREQKIKYRFLNKRLIKDQLRLVEKLRAAVTGCLASTKQ
jgi:hypothetical protein